MLALKTAQSIHHGGPVAVHGSPPRRTSEEVAGILSRNGLLALTDPNWPHLGLDARGRAELAGRIRILGILALRRVATAAAVRDAFAAAEIPAIFLKGFALSTVVWGNARARGAGDIDVMVPEPLLERAAAALGTIGARPRPRQADLRPRRHDRRMHHAVTFRLADTEVDVHYRLDPMSWVLPVDFDEVLQCSREIEVGAERFRTLDDEFSLLLLAANGGRDNWAKWGQVLEFAELYRRLNPGPALASRARELGLGHRYETGLVLTEVLAPDRRHEVDSTARSLASGVLRAHAQSKPRGTWQVIPRSIRSQTLRTRSIGTAQTYRWGITRFIWPMDGVGRDPDSGVGDDVRAVPRRLSVVLVGRGRSKNLVMDPAGYLCDLVDSAARGEIDRDAWAILDTALRTDRLSRSDFAILPLLAPLIERDLPDHPFAAIIAGVRRQNRIRGAAAQNLVDRAAHLLSTDPLVLGDVAAAGDYPDPGLRQVTSSLLVVPGRPEDAHVFARQLASDTDAQLVGGRWPVLQRFGARITLHRAMGAQFDHREGRSLLVEPSPELRLYDSLIRCALGAPLILWYADAVNATSIDWPRMLRIARSAGWVAPVVQALDLLYARGHDVLPVNANDEFLDEMYWNSQYRVARGALRRLRLARRRLG